MAQKEMTTLDKVTYSLVVIGGLNWGLIALLDEELVVGILGFGDTLASIVYGLIGLSAVYCLVGIFKMMQDEKS